MAERVNALEEIKRQLIKYINEADSISCVDFIIGTEDVTTASDDFRRTISTGHITISVELFSNAWKHREDIIDA